MAPLFKGFEDQPIADLSVELGREVPVEVAAGAVALSSEAQIELPLQ